jgi:hypothetical protein
MTLLALSVILATAFVFAGTLRLGAPSAAAAPRAPGTPHDARTRLPASAVASCA